MTRIRICLGLFVVAAALILPASPRPASAAITVTTLIPGTEDALIHDLSVEDFEDKSLLPYFSVTLSVWRTNTTLSANPPVTYAGTLASTWDPGTAISFPNNAWDGTHAFVNGTNFTWVPPFACSMDFEFEVPQLIVGMGLSNFEHNTTDGDTYHSIIVNGVNMGRLEDLPHWVSTASGKNFYLLVTADPATPVQSIVLTAGTHSDGMVVDKLAFDAASSALQTTWGRLKSMYR